MITESASIFLSSTYKDLRCERLAIEKQISRLNQTYIGMEYFSASKETPLEIALDILKKSDISIFVIGHRYGTIEKNSGKSIVEIEYDTAIQNKKFVMVYLKDKSVPILPDQFESDCKAYKKLTKFKDKLKKEHHIIQFKSPEDLAANVGTDLINYLRRRGKWKGSSLEEIKIYEEFWKVLDKQITIVTEAGTETAHPGELELAKNINGVLGLLSLIPTLCELGINYSIENSLDEYLDKNVNLLLDGSCGGNELTKKILNIPLVNENLVFGNKYSSDKYTRWIEDKRKKKVYKSKYENALSICSNAPPKRIIYDYGFLATSI